MKILHLCNFNGVDYQNDMLFHGGRTLFGADYVDYMPARHMYQSALPLKHLQYGRGFSITCRLPDIEVDRTDIVEKIKNKFFDYIIMGSIYRCKDHMDLVTSVYPREKIAFIDGEDHSGIWWELTGRGMYFKRELQHDSPSVLPITFSVPPELFNEKIYEKTRHFATVVPGDHSTYIFRHDQEELYHTDYKESWFAKTKKKAGWDCLRHPEIIANFAFPYFEDLANCPPRTMTHFPKKLVLDYMEKFQDCVDKSYFEILERMYEHGKINLTTTASIKYVLEKLS